jgi:ubiquinone/menaquinone biosynthesis C-methylase UbiE
MNTGHGSSDAAIIEREERLREWFTREYDPIRKIVESLDVGWGGVQRWATGRISLPAQGPHLDIACGYATFLAQLGWRFPKARLVGVNIDFDGAHALARPLLAEAGVRAALVQADARRMPFADGAYASASCFLGLQDIKIGFGQRGVQETVIETVRVLRLGGVFALLDEFAFETYDTLLSSLPVEVVYRSERALDVRWDCEVAKRAIVLYAEGWVAQTRVADEMLKQEIHTEVYRQMEEEVERQLATQGYYVPFGPVRLVVARKTQENAV